MENKNRKALDIQELRRRVEAVRADGNARFSIELPELTALLDRLERAERPTLTADSTALCNWLREHSSGAYRQCAAAADLIEELTRRAERTGAAAPEGWKLVPTIATDEQWGGLARAIVMAFDFNCKTPRKLLEHLESSGHKIPVWMGAEAEMRNDDHTISKGTRAVLIYRAMLDDAPAAPSAPEPAAPHQQAIPEPGHSDSLADRVFNLPCHWNGDPALHSAILMGHTMACEQAHDLLRAHEAAPAGQLDASGSGWISADEAMPEQDQMVAVVFPAWGDYERGRVVTQATFYHGQFVNDDGNETWPPSHWMPLPPLPAQSQPAGPAKGGITNDNEVVSGAAQSRKDGE